MAAVYVFIKLGFFPAYSGRPTGLMLPKEKIPLIIFKIKSVLQGGL